MEDSLTYFFSFVPLLLSKLSDRRNISTSDAVDICLVGALNSSDGLEPLCEMAVALCRPEGLC